MWVLVLITEILISSATNIIEELNSRPLFLRKPPVLNLTVGFFDSLQNYQVNAVTQPESTYPWIARVVHSRNASVPHMCTASCITEGIFITAARCIYTLKVDYTSILYASKRFHVSAFVLPYPMTKQGFDDIGFIIVDTNLHKSMKWSVIELFKGTNRTDDSFQWFADLDVTYGNINYKAVGYATEKNQMLTARLDRKYTLRDLSVSANIELCPAFFGSATTANGHIVPCYHTCTYQEFQKKDPKCNKYLGVEGAAVIDTIRKKLMGVATWGGENPGSELPVGFSVPNSESFFKNYECAKRIQLAKKLLVKQGYFQKICDQIKT